MTSKFLYYTGLITLYLFNNIIDTISIGLLLENKVMNKIYINDNIPMYFLFIILILNICIETCTFYHKFIVDNKLSTFNYKLCINWYCFSVGIYILSCILNFDLNTFTFMQRIIFPLFKLAIVIMNIYACKIRYIHTQKIEQPQFLETVNGEYLRIV